VPPRLGCRFYRAASGAEPARAWLLSLEADVRKKIGADVQRVRWRWPVSKPLVDSFGKGLYEVRTTADGNIYRVLFCMTESAMVLLHGFEKKTQKTPKAEIEQARRRQKEIES
jgi:phage-related protein